VSYRGVSVLAVVPARGGSKGIPRKNLQKVGGVSLVARAAQVVRELAWIDGAAISTDSEEIAEEARTHGLGAPFLRPPEFSADHSRSVDMWRHAWLACEAHFTRTFDISILLEPTSPLRRAADVERVVTAMLDGGHAAAASVSRTPAHFTPQKTLTVDADGRIGFYLPDGARFALRQAIPPYFHRNGICYAVRRSTLVEQGNIIEFDCAAVVIERDVVNIDDEFDLRMANLLAQEAGGAD